MMNYIDRGISLVLRTDSRKTLRACISGMIPRCPATPCSPDKPRYPMQPTQTTEIHGKKDMTQAQEDADAVTLKRKEQNRSKQEGDEGVDAVWK